MKSTGLTRSAFALTWLLAAALLTGPHSCFGADKEDKDAGEAELKRPKVHERHLESARKNRGLHEIVSLHDEIQGYYHEMANLKAIGDPREKRKAERKIERLESKIKRQKRKLEREAERKLKPYEKTYEKNKAKFDALKDQAKELEEAGKADKATKYHQEAAKYSGPMQGAKRQIDIIRWFLFFDEAGE